MARSGNFGDVVERIFQVTTGILALSFLASGILFLWNGHARQSLNVFPDLTLVN
jgi:hypothetical protein